MNTRSKKQPEKTLNLTLPYKNKWTIPETFIDVDGIEQKFNNPSNEGDDIPLEYMVINGFDELYIPKDNITKQLDEMVLKFAENYHLLF